MISLDMKYTSLYWALRFIEDTLDVHIKKYNRYEIRIDAERQSIDYGNQIRVIDQQCKFLKRHKDFVILECIDRLLVKGYKPKDIVVDGRINHPDIILDDIEIYCDQWGNDYFKKVNKLESIIKNNYKVLYTSRLVSGLLEYKNIILYNNDLYNYGLFEDNIALFNIIPIKAKEIVIKQVVDISDFEIFEDELINYLGKSKKVIIPEGITTIGASSFWNNMYIEEVILPNSLLRLGGDAFYYCSNLKKINIPESVWIMGNNPFAGCPDLILSNFSKHFILDEGILFSKDKSNLIHYTISKKDKEYFIPLSVNCLGKHSFYDCNNLEKVIVPKSIIRFENNPFSGCNRLNVDNYSPYYHFDKGIIYNKFKTTIVGVLSNTKIKEYIVPESVTLISRNSFWNCKGIKKIVLTKNINRIGYNPFASCENMSIKSKNGNFKVVDGILYNKDLTELICCTNIAAKEKIIINDSVKFINRGAFSGCKDLKEVDFNKVVDIAKSSFTNCSSLHNIYIPNQLKNIGEWAFAYCTSLLVIEVYKDTIIGKNAFNECPANIVVRG